MAFVSITHPDLKAEAVVAQEAMAVLGPKGWELADPGQPPAARPEELTGPPVVAEQPAKNASTAVWRAYAVGQGMDLADVNEMSQHELVAHFEKNQES